MDNRGDVMNYNEMLVKYIDDYPYDEPIFIDDIKDYFKNIINNENEFNYILKTLYVYINRFVKNKKIVQYLKGIYYKPLKGVFGDKVLSVDKVINKKYIVDKENYKGFYSGAYLFNKLGLTTQIPKDILIVTNECPNYNDYNNKNLNVIIRKPKIEINNDNYKYLQLFDILINKDNIKVEVENEKEIIYKFIKENELEFDKIFKYAKDSNNKKVIDKLFDLG